MKKMSSPRTDSDDLGVFRKIVNEFDTLPSQKRECSKCGRELEKGDKAYFRIFSKNANVREGVCCKGCAKKKAMMGGMEDV